MNGPINTARSVNPEVYTDLNSLQKLKGEENTDTALKKVAQQFESMFVNIMLKNMRNANAVFEKDSLTQSDESKMYRDMYDNQLSLSLSKGKGLGIADVLYRQLKDQYAPADSSAAEPMALEQNLRKARAVDVKPDRAMASAPAESVPVMVKAEDKSFDSPESFIEQLLPPAKRAAKALGLDPVMMLAQSALETGWGKHVIGQGGVSSNNLFNIKADPAWNGDSVVKQTLEFKQGVAVKEQASFRAYGSLGESMQDFIDFLQSNPRYEQALAVSHDAEQFIGKLHEAGYATDPQYSEKVLSVFRRVQSMLASTGPGEG